jgi:hypothetical protein
MPDLKPIESQICEAVVEVLDAIKAGPPTWRSKPIVVRRGITAAEIAGTDRPIVCVMIVSDTDTPRVFGKSHDVTLQLLVYIETADIDNPDDALADVIEDIRTALRGAELLKTADAPGGLLLQPLWLKETDRLIDPSGQGGVGSAELKLEGRYRITHS